LSRKFLYPVLVLAAGAGLAMLLVVTEPPPQVDDYVRPPITVRTVTVSSQAEHLIVRSQGTVQPRTESQLIPEVSGRVNWMSPSLVTGGSFMDGEPLLRIDDADYQNALASAKAALTRTEVVLEHSADELNRLQRLREKNLASQSQVDEVQRRFRVAQADLKEAEIAIQQSQRDLSRTEIKAPYQGLVRNEQVDLGQFISRGSAIATIYADDFVEVRLPIASNQLAYLDISISGELASEPASPVTLSAKLGGTRFIWSGELVRTEAEFDSRSRMLYGIARVRNQHSEEQPPLAVGLFVEAEIQGRLIENVIRLPRSAMRDKDQVLIVDTDNQLRFRQVSLLRIEHDEVLISKGLNNGERVCVSPLQTVVEGMHVQAVEG
jgi:RND family efflux transporter MFP subunit